MYSKVTSYCIGQSYCQLITYKTAIKVFCPYEIRCILSSHGVAPSTLTFRFQFERRPVPELLAGFVIRCSDTQSVFSTRHRNILIHHFIIQTIKPVPTSLVPSIISDGFVSFGVILFYRLLRNPFRCSWISHST